MFVAALSMVGASLVFAPAQAALFGGSRTAHVAGGWKSFSLAHKGNGTYVLETSTAGGGWKQVASQTRRSGKTNLRFNVKVPERLAGQPGMNWDVRLKFTSSKKGAKAKTSALGSYRLVKSTKMPVDGLSKGFRYYSNKDAARWNPCGTLTYKVSKGSSTNKKETANAIKKINDLTGLRFKEAKNGRIDVSFGSSDKKNAGGHASITMAKKAKGMHYREITAAKVVIDPKLSAKWREAVLVHELGHALGLGHITHSANLMSGMQATGTPSAKDIKGFKAVGASHGCF